MVSHHQNPVFRAGDESKVVSETQSKDEQLVGEVTALTSTKVREPDVQRPRMGTTSKNFQRAVDDDDVDAQWKSDSLTKKTHPTHQEDKDDSSTAIAAAKTDIPVAKEGTLHVVRRGFILLVRGVKSTSPAVRCLPPSWRHSGAHTPKRGRTVIVRPFDGHTADFGGFRVDFAAQRPFFPCSGDQCQLVVLKSSSSCSGWSLSRFSGAIGGRCAVKVGRILPFGSLMGYFGLLCAPATSTGCHVRVPALDSPCSILFSLDLFFGSLLQHPQNPRLRELGPATVLGGLALCARSS